MAQSTRLFLFGDQTYDFVPKLRELLAIKDNPILTAFFEQAHFVVRAQMIQSLNPQEHKEARTADLAHMVQKYVDGKLNSAFQTALSCICQLGSFIVEFDDAGKPYPRHDDSYVLGICTGALAAAAISSSSSLSELLPIAVQTVLIAFRLGLCALGMRDRLEIPAQDRDKPWSVVVSDLDPQEAASAIELFCRENVLSKNKQPWITATAPKSCTLSGSPRMLSKLFEMPAFSKLKGRGIPIYVPAHNPQLFTSKDINEILETTPEKMWSAFSTKIPFLSSVSGKLAWIANYRAVVALALDQCLLEPISWDTVEAEVPRLLKSRGADRVIITPFTTSTHTALSAALNSKDIKTEIRKSAPSSERFSHRPGAERQKLAIVSMSGRFPEAQSTEAFWDLLYKGLDVCKEVPRRRWDVETHVDPSGKARNKGATRWGCWLDFTAEFDARFFNISPKEAPQMDPAQRMALMSTYEAMERAGIVPDTTPSTQRNRIGVFHGVTSNDWMETNTAQNIDTYFITGGNRGFIPGRINFCFEFSGPSYTNDTACSSSLAAIHLACNSLWRGDCDTAVAGGTNMIFTPDGHAGLDKGFFLSRTGNCKPFDDNADGYCRAEGVGTLFIKRLEDALADNDPILGVILDTKTNHSAMSDSMTRPHAGAQIDNMTAVLNTACVNPNDLSYIEMHGTGTQVGDAVEMESVLTVFAPTENSRGKDQPLHVGSAKANIGHGEGVSGVTSVIKVLLMMQNNTIVPHCGIKPGSQINRKYPDLGARNVHIAFEPKPWPRTTKPRRVLINNFSAAGGNTALLLEDAPERLSLAENPDPRTNHVIAISGHVGNSLRKNLERLFTSLQQAQNLSISQLSYTTTARRWHHLHRVSFHASSVDEVKLKLEAAIRNGDGINRPKAKPNVVFAFTGQGSQYLGMGKQLFEVYPKFRADLEHFDQLAQTQGFPGFLQVYTSTQGNVEEFLPVVVQLAITCLEMALNNILQSFGIKPSAVIGHSLGEYAALYTAGVCSASDIIYLVGKRAELLQERCQRGTHAMLATRASPTTLKELLGSSNCEVACINGPGDTVLSGSIEEITEAQRMIIANGIKCTALKLPFAFHSAQVQPIMEDWEHLARAATFAKPQIPILSPLLGNMFEESGVITPSYLASHCREKVDFVKALQFAKERGTIHNKTMIIEVGPKPLLCTMVKATLGAQMTTLPTFSQNADVWSNLHTILTSLYSSGLDINWVAYHSPFESSKKLVNLPDYGWDLKEYYIPYEGDWCLHRHKIHCSCANPGTELQTAGYQVPTESTLQRASKLDPTKEAYPEIKATTTLHRVVEEKTEPLGATFIVETDISRKDVNSIAQGHRVDNIPLCTPSFYADIALQVGKYSMDRIRGGHPTAIDGLVDVSDLVVDKALIPHGQAPQLLRTTLTMKWPPKAAATTRSAKIRFATYFADGKLDTEHATCTVRFTTDAQLKSLKKKAPEYKTHIQRLRKGIMKGQFVRYSRKSGYKLMSNMAHFHPDYKLLDDLVLNEAHNEATCMMDFSSASDGGSFAAHPAYVDAITQVAGFAMNANDNIDTDKEMFVNHGWESFQVYQPLAKNKTYSVYTKMEKDKTGDLVHGDIVVLEEDDVVAFFKGLSLRCVPRRALRAILQSSLDKGVRQRGGTPAAAKSVKVILPAAHHQSAATTTAPVENPTEVFTLDIPTTILAAKSVGKTTSTSGKKSNVVLKVISEESGIALEELTDDSNFIDIGIDSLSSMVIGSRLREDLGLDLDTEFSLFVDCPTVRALKNFLGDLPESTFDGSQEGATISQPVVIVTPEAEEPASVLEASVSIPIHSTQSDHISEPLTSPTKPVITEDTETATAALKIIAEESGVAVEDLTRETVFADIGINSLSSLVISSRFREELNLDLDSAFSLFDDVPSVYKLEEFLGGMSIGVSENSSESPEPEGGLTPNTEPEDDADAPVRNLQSYCRPTTSVILQGLPKVAQKILFMLPDGGGSASSYIPIPRLKSDIAIVGLNCPYARDPENMNCTHTAMIESFCNEIRRRQPEGPYHLGGWSSGGAFAYVTAEALINQGEEVHSLIIIDAPVPQVMEKLPVKFYEHCNSVGLFANQPGGNSDGTSPPPSFLIPHFVTVVDVMLDYKVSALKTNHMPRVGIVWATDTVMDEKTAPKMKGMHFMVQKRKDFGPDGWDTVLPGAEFDIVRAEGANHFTLMAKNHIGLISELIDRVMA